MPRTRTKRARPLSTGSDFPDTFLPRSIGRAADRAMEQVLSEDKMLREHGLLPNEPSSQF